MSILGAKPIRNNVFWFLFSTRIYEDVNLHIGFSNGAEIAGINRFK